MEYLPHDVMFQVLLRLPVKSLLQFKCVCKSWYDLITSTSFVRSHTHLAKTIHPERETFLLYNGDGEFELMVYDENTTTGSGSFRFDKVHIPPVLLEEVGKKDIWVTGHCDGMLCLRVVRRDWTDDEYEEEQDVGDDCSVFLWNPSTGDIRSLPSLPQESGPQLSWDVGNDLYGIGYNPLVDDYYVCRVPHRDRASSSFTNLIELFYMKSNSWTTIGRLDGRVGRAQTAVFLNGNLYWLVYDDSPLFEKTPTMIMYFNAAQESVEVLGLPQGLEQDEEGIVLWGTSMGVSHGNICLTKSSYDGMCFWIYEQDSWTKVLHIPIQECSIHYAGYRRYHTPLCLTRKYHCAYMSEFHSRCVLRYEPLVQKMYLHQQFPGSTFLIDKVELFETLISPSALISGDPVELLLMCKSKESAASSLPAEKGKKKKKNNKKKEKNKMKNKNKKKNKKEKTKHSRVSSQ